MLLLTLALVKKTQEASSKFRTTNAGTKEKGSYAFYPLFTVFSSLNRHCIPKVALDTTEVLRRVPNIIADLFPRGLIFRLFLRTKILAGTRHHGTIYKPNGRCDNLRDRVGLDNHRAAVLCQTFEEGGAWLG